MGDVARNPPPRETKFDRHLRRRIIAETAERFFDNNVQLSTCQVHALRAGEAGGVEDGVIMSGFGLPVNHDHHVRFTTGRRKNRVSWFMWAFESNRRNSGIHLWFGLDHFQHFIAEYRASAFNVLPLFRLKVERVDYTLTKGLVKQASSTVIACVSTIYLSSFQKRSRRKGNLSNTYPRSLDIRWCRNFRTHCASMSDLKQARELR